MRENRSGFVKFIVSVVVFVLLVGVSLGGYFAVQYVRGKNSPSSFGPELYYALDMAETNTEYTKVIIGDSVARLIFSPDYQDETDEVCYLATNQAITGSEIIFCLTVIWRTTRRLRRSTILSDLRALPIRCGSTFHSSILLFRFTMIPISSI